jgi:hypothetical protein
MINLTKGATEVVYFTGTENATLSAPYFLFVFENRVTLEVIKVMATNTSTTERYDKFSLIVNNYFSTSTDGFYSYNIYQKASNVDFTLTGLIVEYGYMYLNPTVAFAPTEYAEQSNTFVTYNG